VAYNFSLEAFYAAGGWAKRVNCLNFQDIFLFQIYAKFKRKRRKRLLSSSEGTLGLYAGVHSVTHMCNKMNRDRDLRGAFAAPPRPPAVERRGFLREILDFKRKIKSSSKIFSFSLYTKMG
jgi:hypothetical protein